MYGFSEMMYYSNSIPYLEPPKGSPYATVRLYRCNDESQFADKEVIEDAYLDRMRGWKPEEYKKASVAIGKNSLYRAAGESIENIEKFLTEYNGYPCKLLEVSENLGYDGYHYTYLMWKKV